MPNGRLAPLISPASPGGQPRQTEMRAAMNAIFYLLHTSCPRRYLPREGFPPRSTVYNIFRKFQCEGHGRRSGPSYIWYCVSEWTARPSAAVLDSQSVKSAEKGEAKTMQWVMTPVRR
jgi:putative transposase